MYQAVIPQIQAVIGLFKNTCQHPYRFFGVAAVWQYLALDRKARIKYCVPRILVTII
jgi:hypothetical protein